MRGYGVGVRHTGLCMSQKAPTASDQQVITWGEGTWMRGCRESGGTEAVGGSRFHIKCNSPANLKKMLASSMGDINGSAHWLMVGMNGNTHWLTTLGI